jgi:outer membrane cobalamin receptor
MAAPLAVLLACAALAADDPQPQDAAPAEPPRLREELTVTAAREAAKIADTPASVAILPRDGLLVTAAPFVDDALRQVVGF